MRQSPLTNSAILSIENNVVLCISFDEAIDNFVAAKDRQSQL